MKSSPPEERSKPTIPLQDGTVYGPIHSRRLGSSLGINPLPVSYKFCDFDCVYCQYGWTPEKGTGERLKRAPQLAKEIAESFEHHQKCGTPVDCITIAGNGEPTIHPDFPRFIDDLIELRDRYYPQVKIGILSDSSHAGRPDIRKALEKLDERYMKLDAGSPEQVARINKPRGNFDFEQMIKDLTDLRDIVIQSLFLQGSFDNTSSGDIECWIDVIKRIQPREVQVYTTDRGTADPGIREVPLDRLREIAAECQSKTGIPSVVFE